MIDEIICEYHGKIVRVLDRVTVGIASGTNEYVGVTKYLIADSEGNVEEIYPYQITKIIINKENKKLNN